MKALKEDITNKKEQEKKVKDAEDSAVTAKSAEIKAKKDAQLSKAKVDAAIDVAAKTAALKTM